MVLFDAVAEFIGFLQVALIILLIKEVIGIFSGGSGSSSGGWNMGRLLGGDGGRGPRPGSAAVATAEDKAALAEESVEGRERAAEIAQEARELNDLRAIRQIAYRDLQDYRKIKDDINKMIGSLQRMVKAGRMTPELVDEVRSKVTDAVQYANDIRNLEPTLNARISDLTTLGIDERNNINKMFLGTKREVSAEIFARKNAGWAGTGPNNAKWAQIKQKFEQDAGAMINQQIRTVRSTLASHVVALGSLERAFTGYFTNAEAALRANDIARAILQLEAARSDIDQIEPIVKAIGGKDVDTVQGQIQRRLADLKAETKTATLNSVGIKRQIAVVQKSAAAAKGLRQAGRSVFSGVDRLRLLGRR